jgi:hypothetical protein
MAQTLSKEAEELLEALSQPAVIAFPEEEGQEAIRVSSLTRGLGFLYERIRNALDYHEEHLWLKNAILRILKRRFYEILGGKEIGKVIIEELIRGHYLENNTIPEIRAQELDTVIGKYREVLWLLQENYKREDLEQELSSLEFWFLGIAASEIEEILHQFHQDRAFIDFFYKSMKGCLKVDPELDIKDLDLELYLASYRNFLLADKDMESYILFRLYFPEWDDPSLDFLKNLSLELPRIKERIGVFLDRTIRRDLDRIFKKRSLLVFLLKDIIDDPSESAREVLSDPENLEIALRRHYESRYKANRARLQRSAVRAVVFIFITKMLLALLAEIPYEVVRTGDINFLSVGINTLLPPILLLGAALAIKMPGEEQNFLKIVMDFEKLIAQPTGPVVLDTIRQKKKKSIFTKAILSFLYIFNFFVTFLVLLWFFRLLNFSWLSAALFVFFLSLVSFFALRLRKTANELAAIEENEHSLRAIFDFLIFPIVEVGRLLSIGLRSINVLALVFDFLIEAPFKTVIEVLEEWFTFLRERKQAL